MNRKQICSTLGELVERKHILEKNLERTNQEIARVLQVLSALPPETQNNGIAELIEAQG